MKPALIVIVGLSLLVTAPVLAQSSPDDDQARSLFEAGRIAYENGDFERALGHFQQAYELSGRPELQYNIAQAADRLRHDELALESYERFLAEASDDAPQRRSVEVRVGVLRRTLAERRAREEAAAATDPASAPAPDQPATTSTRDGDGGSVLPWMVLGGSIAVLGTGAVLIGLGASDRSTVEDAPDGVRWEEIQDEAERSQALSITGLVLAGAGAAGVIAAIVLLASDDGSEESLEVGIGPGSLSLAGRFD